MKLPSLHRLVAEAARVARRFPLPLLSSLVICVVGIYFQRLTAEQEPAAQWIFPVLSTAVLGLTLTLAGTLAAERYRWPPWAKLAATVGAVVGLGLWHGACPAEPDIVWGLRLLLLLLAQHLLVAVVPYVPELRQQADTPGFWRYNETLFVRILTAGLYSGVLFAGCALALVAVENLFDVKLDDDLYGHLFLLLATVFNTWFFLAGVPADFAALEQEVAYPKGLKVFTQFVLLPLVVLYLGILYAYMGRIIGQGSLPKGWVSVLVLALSVAGIFALLLIHPIRNAAENTWIRTFARWFYRALFPLLGLLTVAISTRVRAYGITEERYLVLILAAWLALMAAYFLWHRGQGIIWIPASLALVALLAAGGPWGAFAVAERSQLGQLQELIGQYQLLKNGKLDNVGQRVKNLPKPAKHRIASIFDYFTKRDALRRLQPYFTASLVLPDSLEKMESWQRSSWAANQVYELSGIAPYNEYDDTETKDIFVRFRTDQPAVQTLGAGRYWLNDLDTYSERPLLQEVKINEGTYRLRSDGGWQQQISLPLGGLADSLAHRHGRNPGQAIDLPNAGLTMHQTASALTLTLFLHEIARRQREDTVSYSFEGQALLEVRR